MEATVVTYLTAEIAKQLIRHQGGGGIFLSSLFLLVRFLHYGNKIEYFYLMQSVRAALSPQTLGGQFN